MAAVAGSVSISRSVLRAVPLVSSRVSPREALVLTASSGSSRGNLRQSTPLRKNTKAPPGPRVLPPAASAPPLLALAPPTAPPCPLLPLYNNFLYSRRQAPPA